MAGNQTFEWPKASLELYGIDAKQYRNRQGSRRNPGYKIVMNFRITNLLLTVAIIGLFLNFFILSNRPEKVTIAIKTDWHSLVHKLPKTYLERLPPWDWEQNWEPPLGLDLAIGLGEQFASELNSENSSTNWQINCVSCINLRTGSASQSLEHHYVYLVQFKEPSLAQESHGSSGHGCALLLMNGEVLVGDGEIRQSLESITNKFDLQPKF